MRASSEDHQAQLTFKKIKHDLPFPSLPPQKYGLYRYSLCLRQFMRLSHTSPSQLHPNSFFLFPRFPHLLPPDGAGAMQRGAAEGIRLRWCGWADGRRKLSGGKWWWWGNFALINSPPPQQGSGFSRTNTCNQAVFVGTCSWGPALSTGLSHQSKNSARD